MAKIWATSKSNSAVMLGLGSDDVPDLFGLDLRRELGNISLRGRRNLVHAPHFGPSAPAEPSLKPDAPRNIFELSDHDAYCCRRLSDKPSIVCPCYVEQATLGTVASLFLP